MFKKEKKWFKIETTLHVHSTSEIQYAITGPAVL